MEIWCIVSLGGSGGDREKEGVGEGGRCSDPKRVVPHFGHEDHVVPPSFLPPPLPPPLPFAASPLDSPSVAPSTSIALSASPSASPTTLSSPSESGIFACFFSISCVSSLPPPIPIPSPFASREAVLFFLVVPTDRLFPSSPISRVPDHPVVVYRMMFDAWLVLFL